MVLVHGLNRSRIEMARKLPFLNAQGWNALAFDLRHHGESVGEVSSFGAFEKQDVRAAVALAQSRAAGPVEMWGVSLGGATSVLAAAEDAGIRGVVCDSAYRSLRDTAAHHLGLFRGRIWWLRGVPVWPVADEVVYWIGRRGGFDPDSVDVTAAASRLSDRPTLFVCRSNDARMPQEIAVDIWRVRLADSSSDAVLPICATSGAHADFLYKCTVNDSTACSVESLRSFSGVSPKSS